MEPFITNFESPLFDTTSSHGSLIGDHLRIKFKDFIALLAQSISPQHKTNEGRLICPIVKITTDEVEYLTVLDAHSIDVLIVDMKPNADTAAWKTFLKDTRLIRLRLNAAVDEEDANVDWIIPMCPFMIELTIRPDRGKDYEYLDIQARAKTNWFPYCLLLPNVTFDGHIVEYPYYKRDPRIWSRFILFCGFALQMDNSVSADMLRELYRNATTRLPAPPVPRVW